MMRRAALTALILSAFPALAADPELTPLHPPRPAIETMSFMRQSMYDRWQYVAVDHSGHFRARVILDFPQAYYLIDGRPYPFLNVRPGDFIPQILD